MERWQDCDAMTRARLLVFDQTLEHEEYERLNINPFAGL